jgi:pimeloyl-ACP methyl ester carboxylesterase
MLTVSPTAIHFDGYTLDLQQCVLRRGRDEIALRPKSFDVLRYLAENAGRVVGKEELMKAAWPGIFVTDDAVVKCIGDIRTALADDAHRIIRTAPRRGYLFCVETSGNAGIDDAASRSTNTMDTCRTQDGVSIALASAGQGLPLVRSATWFNHLDYDWHVPLRGALLHYLAERFQLVRYDGRGTGLSDRYVPEISFATFEEDLRAVVDALGLQRYALFGISQGAATAISHAVRYPHRVAKLVLNGGLALGRNKRGSAKDREEGEALLTLMRHGWGDAHSAFLRAYALLFYPGASAEQIKGLAELQRMATSAENAIRIRMASADIDVTSLLEKVAVPTLVVHSRYDNAVPLEEAIRLSSRIPNARLLVLESENHVLLPGEPAWRQFTGELEAFLAD